MLVRGSGEGLEAARILAWAEVRRPGMAVTGTLLTRQVCQCAVQFRRSGGGPGGRGVAAQSHIHVTEGTVVDGLAMPYHAYSPTQT